MIWERPGPEDTRPKDVDPTVLRLASDIYRCEAHGLWRIFISGHVEAFKEPEP